jgi:fluoroacetyl-CoA thioesterase
MDPIKPGMTLEAQEKVTPAKSASHIGSGSLQVYSTPSMVSFIERTCHELLAQYLPDTQTSVGTHVDIEHLAPTPLGGTVRARVQVVEVNGVRVVLEAEVWDEFELVGRCRHLRVVIDNERFLQRVQKKLNQPQD